MRVNPFVRLLAIALLLVMVSLAASAQIGIAIRIGPPALPVYEQPPCPAEGYIWTPGYWAYDYDVNDYYWVPGTWVEAPQVGYLWTPGYWGWGGDRFLFHEGYWGPRVGFYGGVAYGYGYFGEGYQGGRWDNGRFFYNRSVNNVNVVNIHNVYNTTVINNVTVNRVSYNGGNGGIDARPRAEDEIAMRERHIGPLAAQTQHVQAARENRELRASVNQGRPPIAATARPGEYRGGGVVPAREAGAPFNAAGRNADNRPANNVPRPPNASHAQDLTPHERPAAPNTGNPKLDQKYQQQQQKLYARQEQDHQKLQQRQEQDHQRLQQRNADDARKQQVEQQHAQQTQQMEQRHTQQTQHMESHQAPHENHQGPQGGKPQR
jgi:WXXGXW repeat (2 copies)